MASPECSCTGNSLDRFVKPSVMAVLVAHPEGMHGYGIVQQLAQIPLFLGCPPDMTGLYRVLKSMEDEGYLSSSWDLEGSGPARRVYRLTDDGRECLQYWTQTLQNYAKNLEGTVRYIEDSLRSGGAVAPPPI